MMTGAQAMVKCLENEGVKDVFGYPGAAICPFYDALADSGIRHILVRQEQNAGHAASGYARVSGRPAVCIATSGPGATNLITALATAYMDSIPVIAITGQVSSEQLGRDVFQEADITGAAEPFTKYSYIVKNAADIPRIFKEAFTIAGSGRPGPVLIDIPIDVQNKKLEFHYPESVAIRGYKPTVEGNFGQIKRVAKALADCEKPVICVGGGVFFAKAADEVLRLSQKLRIPVVSTMMGLGAVPGGYDLFLGMMGMHGVAAANLAIREADLLLIVGARIGDRAVNSPDAIANNTKIVHIDIDPAEIGKNVGVHIPLVGDAKNALSRLAGEVAELDFSEWSAQAVSRKKTGAFPARENGVNPKRFMAMFSNAAPEDTILVADVGQNQIWSANYFQVKKGRFLTSGGMGTMGYSVPAAMGAKCSRPDAPVFAVCGDGSFQMQMMELATIVQHQIPVKIVLMQNARLGMVRELQTNQYHGNCTAVFLDGSPDFLKLAEAYGIPASRVVSDAEIPQALEALFAAQGPYLLVCDVDPGETSL